MKVLTQLLATVAVAFVAYRLGQRSSARAGTPPLPSPWDADQIPPLVDAIGGEPLRDRAPERREASSSADEARPILSAQ